MLNDVFSKNIYEKIGRIHSLQTMGLVDGPGVRFVAFLQGCPLRCEYCHNPDTHDFAGGKVCSVKDLLKRINRYRVYFGKFGGVTFSGGEPLGQAEFLLAAIRACQQEGIHTALDTSGFVFDYFGEKVIAEVDLLILDFKFTNAEDYQNKVGCSMAVPLNALSIREKVAKPVWLRQVIVPGQHDNAENIGHLRKIIKKFSCIEKVELLPFRKLCLAKYENMGKAFPLIEQPEASSELIDQLTGELDFESVRGKK
ncbi:MAG: pyruvate formate-lyase-activating protein [Clostridia bacterium]|nr:pyruvate formate-lyase-activating protein [Clostridia bacterium]